MGISHADLIHRTRAQQLLRWATVLEQSERKSGGAAVPLSAGGWVPT